MLVGLLDKVGTVVSFHLYMPDTKVERGTPRLNGNNLDEATWEYLTLDDVFQRECFRVTVILKPTEKLNSSRYVSK